MRLFSDTARQIDWSSRTGRYSGEFELRADLDCLAPSEVQVKSSPPASRKRQSVHGPRANAAASGSGILDYQISRLETANREWFDWRFNEDA